MKRILLALVALAAFGNTAFAQSRTPRLDLLEERMSHITGVVGRVLHVQAVQAEITALAVRLSTDDRLTEAQAKLISERLQGLFGEISASTGLSPRARQNLLLAVGAAQSHAAMRLLALAEAPSEKFAAIEPEFAPPPRLATPRAGGRPATVIAPSWYDNPRGQVR